MKCENVTKDPEVKNMLLYYILAVIILTLTGLLADKRLKNKILSKHSNTLDRRGRYTEVEGMKLYYIEEGAGFPLVLIHGFMSCSEDFSRIIHRLSRNNKVLAVDLIGFGHSDKRNELNYSKKNMAAVVHKFMKSKGYKKYNVLGHSMGGGVALNLAYFNPENVKSLILVDSVGYIKKRRPVMSIFLIEHFFKSYFLQKLFYRFCFYKKSNLSENKFNQIFCINSRIPAETLLSFSRNDDSETIEGNARGICCPTLILWGKHDRVTPVESGSRFNRDIAGSRLILFEESGHLPYVEEEEKFISAIEEFLNKH
jgi:pimeloyl-ACP methyl ester carboxylesterase